MNQLVYKVDTTIKADTSQRHFLEAQQLCRDNCKPHRAGSQIGRLGDMMHIAQRGPIQNNVQQACASG